MNIALFSDKIPHRLYEKQVSIFPNEIAVFTETQSLTYMQLNEKANQLAHYLVEELAVQLGEPVGVCSQHEPDRVLALMAIVKAGATYVPIDPFHPVERINYMTSKINARFILNNRYELTMKNSELDASIIDLDEVNYEKFSTENLQIQIASSEPMYIIFTSGSTGAPKAAAISHRAAYNHFAWVMDYTQFSPEDIWLQTINPSFDPSMHELMAPLMIGGKIALIGGMKNLDSREIAEAIIACRATHITTVPTMLTLLVNTPRFSECRTLKHVCVGGEVFHPALAQRAMQQLPDTKFHNVYGPTEATIMASGWYIEKPELRNALPIGSAIYNMKFYIKSDAGEILELAPNLEGELCISGVSLANGYVNDDALTNMAFVANPLVADKNSIYQKIYLSGDRCRTNENGDLYCLGRLDSQVKINGYRIELAEVEYQFTILDDIDDVGAFKINNELTVAVVPKQQQVEKEKWLASIRERVSKKLPTYMLPKNIILMESIPKQDISAKADRKKLEEMLLNSMSSSKPISTQQENKNQGDNIVLSKALLNTVVEISKGIAVDNDELESSFSELGLDSVDLQTLTLRVNQQYKIDLRTEELFEYYTIKKLADHIERQLVAA